MVLYHQVFHSWGEKQNLMVLYHSGHNASIIIVFQSYLLSGRWTSSVLHIFCFVMWLVMLRFFFVPVVTLPLKFPTDPQVFFHTKHFCCMVNNFSCLFSEHLVLHQDLAVLRSCSLVFYYRCFLVLPVSLLYCHLAFGQPSDSARRNENEAAAAEATERHDVRRSRQWCVEVGRPPTLPPFPVERDPWVLMLTRADDLPFYET